MIDCTLSVVSHAQNREVLGFLKKLTSIGLVFRQTVVTLNVRDPDVVDFSSLELESIVILQNLEPHGFGDNHNFASDLAVSDNFCVINSDLDFGPNLRTFFCKALGFADQRLVSPAISSDGLSWFHRRKPFLAMADKKYFEIPDIPPSGGYIHTTWLSGCFLLFLNNAFRSLDGFSRQYFMYFEDVDLSVRARGCSIPVVVDKTIQVRHRGRRLSRRSIKHFLMYIQSCVRFSVKHFKGSGF